MIAKIYLYVERCFLPLIDVQCHLQANASLHDISSVVSLTGDLPPQQIAVVRL